METEEQATKSIVTGEPDGATFIVAEPQLFVSDLASSLSFYVDRLGFALSFSYGEPPSYAQVARGGAHLNLRCVSGPVFDSRFREREADALSATVTLTDVEPVWLELKAAGVTFHQSLRTEPWGARTFIVRDPDGNLIAFAGPGSQAASAGLPSTGVPSTMSK